MNYNLYKTNYKPSRPYFPGIPSNPGSPGIPSRPSKPSLLNKNILYRYFFHKMKIH